MKFKTLFIVALMATLWSTDSFSQECKPVTFDGYTYGVVQIGNQCWFAENLRTEHYANGDEIPGDLSYEEWKTTDSGARAVYGEDGSSRQLLENLNTYGGLYNCYAVDDERGLCPTGWHVPSDGEWMVLEMELGMTSAEAKNSKAWRGTQGAQLKSSASDTPPWYGSNSSGFSGLPGGQRNDIGYFFSAGRYGYWWSSSPYPSDAWYRILSSDSDWVGRYIHYDNRRYGFSVRCVRD